MPGEILGSIAGAAISSGGNIISDLLTNRANAKLTRESWARDDKAVQRRAADLQAAGINPLLAAGQAANNSSPIPLKSPEIADFGGAFISGVQAKRQKEQIENQKICKKKCSIKPCE